MKNTKNYHLDNVHFYCSKCNSLLFQLQHHEYQCECGLKWITPHPVCLSDEKIKAVMIVNGKEEKYESKF